MNPDGSGFSLLKEFAGPDGEGPLGALVGVGGVLYGTTFLGGSEGVGTIFYIQL
jgi:hypothetical protein